VLATGRWLIALALPLLFVGEDITQSSIALRVGTFVFLSASGELEGELRKGLEESGDG